MESESIRVKKSELPLSCPDHRQTLWDFHPRIYLPIEKKGSITCPYCKQEYILVEDD